MTKNETDYSKPLESPNEELGRSILIGEMNSLPPRLWVAAQESIANLRLTDPKAHGNVELAARNNGKQAK